MAGRNNKKRSVPLNGRPGLGNGAPTPPDVLLGFLSGSSIATSFYQSITDLMQYDAHVTHRIHKRAVSRGGPLAIASGRNKLCQNVLDDPELNWLFMLDDDMGFEQDILARLLAVADAKERPVVGGLCFMQREIGADGLGGFQTYPFPTIFHYRIHADGVGRFTGVDDYPANTMFQADATGAACILIHKSALQTIGKDWFTQLPECEDGPLMGEDISFCSRLREAGIPLWVHTGARTTHYKARWLGESDFWNNRVVAPATERVDVIIPALHRPQNVKPLMDSLRASTGLATAWWIVEEGDSEEIAAVEASGGLWMDESGTFAHKVNYAYREQGPDFRLWGQGVAPWVLLVGDDVRFLPGWLDQALCVANRWKADVVATNDLLNPRVMRGEHATHPLIRRSYIEEFGGGWDGPGIVCHEGYSHWYVDDEITQAAIQRGRFKPALGSHVAHLHPLGGHVEMDDVYRKGELHKDEDRALFQQRHRASLTQGAAGRLILHR